jgi:hypothetical protein
LYEGKKGNGVVYAVFLESMFEIKERVIESRKGPKKRNRHVIVTMHSFLKDPISGFGEQNDMAYAVFCRRLNIGMCDGGGRRVERRGEWSGVRSGSGEKGYVTRISVTVSAVCISEGTKKRADEICWGRRA